MSSIAILQHEDNSRVVQESLVQNTHCQTPSELSLCVGWTGAELDVEALLSKVGDEEPSSDEDVPTTQPSEVPIDDSGFTEFYESNCQSIAGTVQSALAVQYCCVTKPQLSQLITHVTYTYCYDYVDNVIYKLATPIQCACGGSENCIAALGTNICGCYFGSNQFPLCWNSVYQRWDITADVQGLGVTTNTCTSCAVKKGVLGAVASVVFVGIAYALYRFCKHRPKTANTTGIELPGKR